jgi:SAM-dependent methyltransferase
MDSFWLNTEWATEEYQQLKKENFTILDKELSTPPLKILDIGCGLAWESRLFNQKYNSELWLLDGDISNNDSKPSSAKDINYHETADNFLFYHPLTKLDDELKKLGTKNYHLVDCNNINLPNDLKFDLITSWLSCGFHYPASTYRELILKHSHENTKVVMDIRAHLKTKELFLEAGIHVVKKLIVRRKSATAEIKFV